MIQAWRNPDDARREDAAAWVVRLESGDLSDAEVSRHAPYDLVFANILAAPLIHLSGPIHGVLKPGGHAILSGLLRSQEEEVAGAYTALGFTVERVIHHDAWSALLLRRG